MKDHEIRLCMIGAGRHSSANIYPYFHYLHFHDNARVVANADLDIEKAKHIASLFGIQRSYEDYREMLEKEQPDGVIICVGEEFHPVGAIDVMERGFNVYTEKPPAQSLEMAQKVVAAKQKTGKICMTAFKKRYAPAYVKAKSIIDSEDFGQPTMIALLRTSGPGDPNYLLDNGCHAFDLIPYLFGRVDLVSVFKTPGRIDAYSINMLFRNGAVGNMSLSNRPRGLWEEVTACGSDGVTVRTQNSIFMQAYKGNQPFAQHCPSFTQSGHGHVEQGFVGELQEFVRAIRGGYEPKSSIEESVHSIAIYEAVKRSAETGQPEEVESIKEILHLR